MVYVPTARVADIDPELLLVTLLRPAMGDLPGGTLTPADVADRLGAADTGGYWVVRPVVGGPAADDRFADGCGVQVDGYAADRARARWVCRTAVAALTRAWSLQTTTPHGHLASLRFDVWPYEVRDRRQPAGMWRFVAAGSAVLRPPTD